MPPALIACLCASPVAVVIIAVGIAVSIIINTAPN